MHDEKIDTMADDFVSKDLCNLGSNNFEEGLQFLEF